MATDSRSRPYSASRGCPDGYHKRREYTSKSGHRVGPRCIRSTTLYKNTSAEMKRKAAATQKSRLKLYIPSMRTLSRKVCPPGQIERKAYVRRFSSKVRQAGYTRKLSNGRIIHVKPQAKSTLVESRCVKNTGKPGKGVPKPIGPLRKGELAKHGYSVRSDMNERHKALRHAIAEYGALGVYRKLDAVSKLTEKTIPEASRVYEKDRNWVRSSFSIKAFS
jgi:hypothetical protein